MLKKDLRIILTSYFTVIDIYSCLKIHRFQLLHVLLILLILLLCIIVLLIYILLINIKYIIIIILCYILFINLMIIYILLLFINNFTYGMNNICLIMKLFFHKFINYWTLKIWKRICYLLIIRNISIKIQILFQNLYFNLIIFSLLFYYIKLLT